mmetsp:Transcript_22183/g.39933  ORF Transcript_22183/g.39933 Transcript_22183/m.39933 type:complete len:252 (-) Transcript_22183:547-1302(-)
MHAQGFSLVTFRLSHALCVGAGSSGTLLLAVFSFALHADIVCHASCHASISHPIVRSTWIQPVWASSRTSDDRNGIVPVLGPIIASKRCILCGHGRNSCCRDGSKAFHRRLRCRGRVLQEPRKLLHAGLVLMLQKLSQPFQLPKTLRRVHLAHVRLCCNASQKFLCHACSFSWEGVVHVHQCLLQEVCILCEELSLTWFLHIRSTTKTGRHLRLGSLVNGKAADCRRRPMEPKILYHVFHRHHCLLRHCRI